MSEKQHILSSIAALAKRLGHSPSLVDFVAHTGTCKHSVFRLFPKWNEAVRAAGLEPRRLYVRPRDEELLEDWGEAVRRKGGLLTRVPTGLEGDITRTRWKSDSEGGHHFRTPFVSSPRERGNGRMCWHCFPLFCQRGRGDN